jgi:hypothetical protein
MVFLNLRSGSKAGLLFHSKHASRRNARTGFRAESRKEEGATAQHRRFGERKSRVTGVVVSGGPTLSLIT